MCWGLESARPEFESLSLEGQLGGKIVGMGGQKGADTACVKDLRVAGGLEDRARVSASHRPGSES